MQTCHEREIYSYLTHHKVFVCVRVKRKVTSSVYYDQKSFHTIATYDTECGR